MKKNHTEETLLAVADELGVSLDLPKPETAEEMQQRLVDGLLNAAAAARGDVDRMILDGTPGASLALVYARGVSAGLEKALGIVSGA